MSDWQTIDSAPKGGGAEFVTDDTWVEPPKLLLAFKDGSVDIGYWDWFYAEGGRGYRNGQAWCDPSTGEPFDMPPTHWMSVPPSPAGAAHPTK